MAARPLALIAGRIHEHPDTGSYPLIRIDGARLRAGGAGHNVYLLGGRLVEVRDDAPYVAPGYWADGYADAYVNEGYVNGGYVGPWLQTENRYVEQQYVAVGYVSTAPQPPNKYAADGYVAGGYVTA